MKYDSEMAHRMGMEAVAKAGERAAPLGEQLPGDGVRIVINEKEVIVTETNAGVVITTTIYKAK